MKKRQSGVLMHISSLPGQYGIGSFGQSAYDFVDFLVRTKQRYWQILPLGTTSYGDSPYQSFSAFAGNTHFIDFYDIKTTRLDSSYRVWNLYFLVLACLVIRPERYSVCLLLFEVLVFSC